MCSCVFSLDWSSIHLSTVMIQTWKAKQIRTLQLWPTSLPLYCTSSAGKHWIALWWWVLVWHWLGNYLCLANILFFAIGFTQPFILYYPGSAIWCFFPMNRSFTVASRACLILTTSYDCLLGPLCAEDWDKCVWVKRTSMLLLTTRTSGRHLGTLIWQRKPAAYISKRQCDMSSIYMQLWEYLTCLRKTSLNYAVIHLDKGTNDQSCTAGKI